MYFDIWIHYKVITTKSLVTIQHHTIDPFTHILPHLQLLSLLVTTISVLGIYEIAFVLFCLFVCFCHAHSHRDAGWVVAEVRPWRESGQEALERRALPGAAKRPRRAASFSLGVGGPMSAPLRCQPFCQRGGSHAAAT